MRNVLAYVKPYSRRVIAGISIKALGTVADLALPLLLAFMIDTQLPGSDYSGILLSGIIMFVVSLSGLVTNLYANYCGAVVSQDFARDLRNALFSKTTRFSLPDADVFGIPSLINRINSDVHSVQNIVLMMMRIVIRAPILLLGGIIMTFILDPVLSVVLILTMPVLSLVIWYGMKKIIPIYKSLQKAIDRMILVMRENLQGFKVVRALSTEEQETHRFHESSGEVRENDFHSGRILAVINPGMTLVMNLGLVATVWFGGVRVSYGAMQTGEIVAFVNYFLMILNALLIITRILIAYTKAVVSAKRIEDVLLYESAEHTAPPMARKAPDSMRSSREEPPLVHFDHVSFSYPGAVKEILHDISFEIRKGQTFAIIGSTGSGKSTLINLLLGLYSATSGVIRFDGIPLDEWDPSDLRGRIRVVFQEPMLFSQTIEKNLRWGKAMASDEEIETALEVSQAKEFVDHFEQKDRYPLSQGGQNLSGGQRQRLAIARALLANAPLLILDDSASALDAITEANLRHSLKTRLGSEKTLIMIAQRISSIRNADRILVLEEGRVDSVGTHRELLQASPVYREIVASQGGGTDR